MLEHIRRRPQIPSFARQARVTREKQGNRVLGHGREEYTRREGMSTLQ
jgi:hypothetical protein